MTFIKNELSLEMQEQSAPAFYPPNSLDLKQDHGSGLFSYFNKPVTNTSPALIMSPKMAYLNITSTKNETVTRVLRSIASPESARNYKARNFNYSCFSGTFTSRGDKNLIKHSGFITLDFDHIKHPGTLEDELIVDKNFETVITFISPSGDGLKWIVKIDMAKHSHLEWFRCLEYYVNTKYGFKVDKSGKDISRCCFLPFDPQAYINPKYLL